MGKKDRKRSAEEDLKEERGVPEEENEGLMFEDPFEDEFMDEEFVEDEDDENSENENPSAEIENTTENQPKQTWRPGIDKLPEGEELEYDPNAYVMYHALKTEWPCLSFDIVKDNLGENRQRFPMSMYVVVGSQADRADKNKVTLLKLGDLNKINHHDSESESESDEDSETEEDPTLEHINVDHVGGINRIRCMPQTSGIVATMADTGKVNIYDLTACAHNMMYRSVLPSVPTGPVYSFTGHKAEGYGIDWSEAVPGRLATGDCNGQIYIWNVETGVPVAQLSASNASYVAPRINCNNFENNRNPYLGHKSSVEDIQWSPSEGTVFCTASSDKSIRIWDIRGKGGPQITVNDAHLEDVNVLSWNRSVGYLIASGSDDGSFKVWDLRKIKQSTSLAHFNYHKGSITSIEWAPHDESLLAVSSSDDQVTVWDLSVEADEEEVSSKARDEDFGEYPPQLLFIHQGQHNVKELHFHKQIPGAILTTAEDGFNVFKPAISVATE